MGGKSKAPLLNAAEHWSRHWWNQKRSQWAKEGRTAEGAEEGTW